MIHADREIVKGDTKKIPRIGRDDSGNLVSDFGASLWYTVSI